MTRKGPYELTIANWDNYGFSKCANYNLLYGNLACECENICLLRWFAYWGPGVFSKSETQIVNPYILCTHIHWKIYEIRIRSIISNY